MIKKFNFFSPRVDGQKLLRIVDEKYFGPLQTATGSVRR